MGSAKEITYESVLNDLFDGKIVYVPAFILNTIIKIELKNGWINTLSIQYNRCNNMYAIKIDHPERSKQIYEKLSTAVYQTIAD